MKSTVYIKEVNELNYNILMIGGGPEIVDLLHSLEEEEIYNIYCVSEIPMPKLNGIRKNIIVKFSNWKNTVDTINDINVKFDTLICSDEAMTHVADEIANELKLPPISHLNSAPFRFKDRMRVICESHNIKTPKYKILHNYSDSNKLETWDYPLIVKPTSFLSSIGVKKVDTFQELQQRTSMLLNLKFPIYVNNKIYELGDLYNLENRVLVEEYIQGNEFSIESLIFNGEYIPLGITKKIVNEDSFSDEVGHIFPAKIEKEIEEKILNWSEKLHKVLLLNNIATHTEFRINETGIYLMEIGARIGGDKISKLMMYSFLQHFSYFKEYINIRLGIEPLKPEFNTKYTGIAFIKIPPKLYGKIYNGVNLPMNSIKSTVLEKEFTMEEGDVLPNPSNWSNERIGYVILQNANYEILEKDIKHIIKNSIFL